MINKIIDGICEALNGEFGDDYKIYTESVEQGLIEPCFFVQCLLPKKDLFFDKRYENINPFMVQYFPKSSESNYENLNALGKLFECLETITVDGDLTMGSKMSGEIVDGILNFKVNYDFFTRKVIIDDNKMDSYGISQNVRKE